MTLDVTFRVVKHGGREDMQLPEGGAQPRTSDSTLVTALEPTFRWKRILESGEYASISKRADKEGIAFTYMARLMRLSLLRFEGGVGSESKRRTVRSLNPARATAVRWLWFWRLVMYNLTCWSVMGL